MYIDGRGYRCDAEIGRIGAWHGCGKPASVGITTESKHELHYCATCWDRRKGDTTGTYFRRKPLEAPRALDPVRKTANISDTTPGQIAYETELRAKPNYHDGTVRAAVLGMPETYSVQFKDGVYERCVDPEAQEDPEKFVAGLNARVGFSA